MQSGIYQYYSDSFIFFSDTSGKRKFTVNNHDAFLNMYKGAIGIKTGFTGKAGYCFVGAARRGDTTLTSCVLASGWPPDKNFKWNDTKALMDYGFSHFSYYNEDNVVKKGDIVVVASTGSSVLIGKTGFATNDIPNTQIGAFLRIVRPNKQVLPHYINAIFLSDYYKTYIRNIAKGSNINNIKNSYITDFVIALPPYQEQIRIVSKIEELFAVLDDIKESLE